MSHADAHHDAHHGPMHYIKIYFILLVLLIISVLGPELEIRILTLITAFGIAVIKALMVASHFMHLNVEKRYIWYMLITMLLFMLLFFSGVATDAMKPEGRNWENDAAKALIQEHSAGAATDGAHQ